MSDTPCSLVTSLAGQLLIRVVSFSSHSELVTICSSAVLLDKQGSLLGLKSVDQ